MQCLYPLSCDLVLALRGTKGQRLLVAARSRCWDRGCFTSPQAGKGLDGSRLPELAPLTMLHAKVIPLPPNTKGSEQKLQDQLHHNSL